MMDTRVVVCLLLVTVFYVSYANCHNKLSQRAFTIDYDNDQFLKDGKPFRYVSGSLHYFRVPREYWQDRLRKMRALGLNAVCTYIEWKFHEPLPGQFDFTGQRDIEHFINLAQQEGLLVILRPGPYICTERDFGGYPIWLLNKNPNILLRSSDRTHKKYVKLWFKELFPRIKPLLYGNGGPVIMIQVENEYGSYIVCDRHYTIWLRNLYRSYVSDKAILFTTDGHLPKYLRCTIPGVFITVDFGPDTNITTAFDPMRKIQKRGPLVNSEFYVGRLSHWGDPPAFFPGFSPSTANILDATRQLLELGVSFNFYMIAGGTNYDFTSGANRPLRPQVTSYDFFAPISESGNLTSKYYALKEVLSEYLPIPEESIIDSQPEDYGTVVLEPKVSLFQSNSGIPYGVFKHPQTFESLKLYAGLMLYETVLPQDYQGQGILSAEGIHDRTIVFIDQKFQAVLSRTYNVTSLILGGSGSQTLGLLVENQGHINYQDMHDLKGILSNVTLDGVILTKWNHTGYPLDNDLQVYTQSTVSSIDLPGYFSGEFQIPNSQGSPQDTFIDMTGWNKGVLYVNGVNLGRYWPLVGPQITLYCPGTVLRTLNHIVVLEYETASPNMTVSLVANPIYLNVTPTIRTSGGVLFG